MIIVAKVVGWGSPRYSGVYRKGVYLTDIHEGPAVVVGRGWFSSERRAYYIVRHIHKYTRTICKEWLSDNTVAVVKEFKKNISVEKCFFLVV